MDLGPVASVTAESFGEPGQRTFRLHVETAEGQVSLWLEKEQMVMLGAAVSELLEQVPADAGNAPAASHGSTFVGELEVRSGSLSVGFDSSEDGFRLTAEEFTSQLPVSSITLLASREQFSAVEDQISDIVAASRPRCVLCGTPLTGDPHFCAESNGHARLGREE